MSDSENEFADQLKSKRICRFCLTQEEPLTNIYSSENRKNSRAPLPLQIMACVSIEVKLLHINSFLSICFKIICFCFVLMSQLSECQIFVVYLYFCFNLMVLVFDKIFFHLLTSFVWFFFNMACDSNEARRIKTNRNTMYGCVYMAYDLYFGTNMYAVLFMCVNL